MSIRRRRATDGTLAAGGLVGLNADAYPATSIATPTGTPGGIPVPTE